MAWRISNKAREWVKANEGKHFCGCGCGEPFKISPEHYRHGVPAMKRGHHPHPCQPEAERFFSWVEKGEGCWLWTGSCHGNGYGQFRLAGSPSFVEAHRYAWTLTHGAIPDGLLVLHRCDTPACVNPEHLFLGTQVDNMADMKAKGRANHARGERCGNSKLTAPQVLEMRRLGALGVRTGVLAKMFGVVPSAVRYIMRRKTWAHLSPA